MIICLIAGLALGVFFYGGLWMTVQRIASTRHPATLVLGSLILRMSVVLAGFVLLLNGRWQNALAILLGLVAGRIAVSRFLALCT